MGLWAGQLVFVKWSRIEAFFFPHPGTPRTKLVVEAELC